MRARSTCTRGLLLFIAAVTFSSTSWAQPLPGADDGTRSKPTPKKPAEPEVAEPAEPAQPTEPGQPAPPRPSAEPSDEADVDDVSEDPDPSRPPPAGKGAVWGVVKSKASDETILEAIVSVIGRKEYGTTDVDGRYRVELPPGTYQLRIVYELHKPARLKNVVVQAGKLNRIDIALQPDETAVEEVTAIEAEAERASAATQLMLRKNAAQASDSIGAQDIAKTPDRNAAEAVKRVVGTTVVDGRYIFVRGLGDRYTNSLLNGAPLPSPEPDRQAVPLDMFPTLVLSDLTISKTFVPDMPGDFAGGSLNIHTRDLPNKFLFQVTGGLGANTLSTFGNRVGYQGGSTDWLGIDDGGRKLPAEVPGSRVVGIDSRGQRSDLTQIGRAVNRDMALNRDFNLPHGTVSTVIGDSFKLGGQRVLGYVVGGTYSRRFQKRTNEILRRYDLDAERPGELVMRNDYRAETGTDTVTWSGLGTVSYAFDNDHKVAVTGLYSRNAENEGRRVEGRNDESLIRDERLRFLNRALMYGQVRGEHRFRNLDNAILGWSLLQSRATMNDPAMRQTAYDIDPATGQYAYTGNAPTSGQNFFAAQGETTRSAVLDWTQPLAKYDGAPKLKAGGMVTLRGRTFQARRFRFQRNNGVDRNIFFRPPGELFVDENVGSIQFNNAPLELEEWTRATDSYAARYDVYAGYVMTDLPVTSRLRFVVGPRLESAVQTVDSYDPFSGSTERVQSRLSRTDILPSANAIVKVTKESNIRLSATRTVARPQLRELAPFLFTEYLGAREVLGNPDLDRTTISNFDARFELFPRVSEVLAVSVFHKRFTKPIETFIIPTGKGVVSYQNAKGAVNTGVELEGRKGLDFIRPWLDEFTLLANFTWVHSRVELDAASGGIQTSQDRPLAGQSPFVVNTALDWTHDKTKTRARILYNVQGKRISEVGTQGIPDTYEQPRHMVDVSVAQGVGEHVDLKFTIENLFDSPVRFTQGESGDAPLVRSYTLGQTFWLLATYSN